MAKTNRASMAGARTAVLPDSPTLRNSAANPSKNVVANGKPVDPAFAHLAIDDREVMARFEEPRPGRARVTGDPLDKQIAHRRADLEDDFGSEATDPMRELTDKYVQRGFRGRFLAPAAIQRAGMRGYQAVTDERGEVVKLGTMILGEMPEAAARKRNARFRAIGNEKIEQIHSEFEEGQQGIASGVRNGRSRNPHSPAPGEYDGLHATRGNQAEEVLR